MLRLAAALLLGSVLGCSSRFTFPDQHIENAAPILLSPRHSAEEPPFPDTYISPDGRWLIIRDEYEDANGHEWDAIALRWPLGDGPELYGANYDPDALRFYWFKLPDLK